MENENRKLPAGGRHLTCLTRVPQFQAGNHQMRQKVCKLHGDRQREMEGRKGRVSRSHLPVWLCFHFCLSRAHWLTPGCRALCSGPQSTRRTVWAAHWTSPTSYPMCQWEAENSQTTVLSEVSVLPGSRSFKSQRNHTEIYISYKLTGLVAKTY